MTLAQDLAEREMDRIKLEGLRERLTQLQAASRPHEPLSDASGPTVQGHVASAITKLQRQIDALTFSAKR